MIELSHLSVKVKTEILEDSFNVVKFQIVENSLRSGVNPEDLNLEQEALNDTLENPSFFSQELAAVAERYKFISNQKYGHVAPIVIDLEPELREEAIVAALAAIEHDVYLMCLTLGIEPDSLTFDYRGISKDEIELQDRLLALQNALAYKAKIDL